MEEINKLTNLQLEILKAFSFDLNENQILEIRSLLANYFDEQTSKEVDLLWENSDFNNETMEKWAAEHLRTSYE